MSASTSAGNDVDLINIRSASTAMRMQVVTTGSVLFEKEPLVQKGPGLL